MITVKDIREKEFNSQKHGYHEEEVDEFLDEIADQMEELIRENRALLTQLDDAKAAVANVASAQPITIAHKEPVAVAAPVAPVKAAEPPMDEPSYFRNLEATLRETLLSAQRIADNTVAEARAKAKELVANAQTEATKISSEATMAAANAKTELEGLKKSHEDYKTRFVRMVKEQMNALKIDEDELK